MSTTRQTAPAQPALPGIPSFPRFSKRHPITTPTSPLNQDSPISEALLWYGHHLAFTTIAFNSARNFYYDLCRFAEHIGQHKPLNQIETSTILTWIRLLSTTTPPLRPRTVNRRVSSVRHFFGWLRDSNVISISPADPIPCLHITPPLASILSEDELSLVLDAAKDNLRTHLIVVLLASTGIKKGELMRIRWRDFDLTDPSSPVLTIRYEPPHAHKNRSLQLPAEAVALLKEYVTSGDRYSERLFPCTARSIEYTLSNLSRGLDLGKDITANVLRDTYAALQIRAGVPVEQVLEHLGLSRNDWNGETRNKYLILAGSTPK